MATILKGSESDLFFLSEHLRSGGVAAVPTETVYGLAANALDAAACLRIFEIKQRPAHDPLIVHAATRAAADAVAVFNETAERLARDFWPGPLTLVLPKTAAIPGIVTSNRATVAVRVPAHAMMQALLRCCGLPLAAPSANRFGYVSPTTVEHVQAGLGESIDYILDGGPCAIGVESTIIDVRDEAHPVLLRPGGIGLEAIETALGRSVRALQSGASDPAQVSQDVGALAPGLLDKHYSPRTPVLLRTEPFDPDDIARVPLRIARVCFQKPSPAPSTDAAGRVFWLSERGDLEDAARRLFGLMRALDTGEFDSIEFEPAPRTGLGVAINDRLGRAAAR